MIIVMSDTRPHAKQASRAHPPGRKDFQDLPSTGQTCCWGGSMEIVHTKITGRNWTGEYHMTLCSSVIGVGWACNHPAVTPCPLEQWATLHGNP